MWLDIHIQIKFSIIPSQWKFSFHWLTVPSLPHIASCQCVGCGDASVCGSPCTLARSPEEVWLKCPLLVVQVGPWCCCPGVSDMWWVCGKSCRGRKVTSEKSIFMLLFVSLSVLVIFCTHKSWGSFQCETWKYWSVAPLRLMTTSWYGWLDYLSVTRTINLHSFIIFMNHHGAYGVLNVVFWQNCWNRETNNAVNKLWETKSKAAGCRTKSLKRHPVLRVHLWVNATGKNRAAHTLLLCQTTDKDKMISHMQLQNVYKTDGGQ